MYFDIDADVAGEDVEATMQGGRGNRAQRRGFLLLKTQLRNRPR